MKKSFIILPLLLSVALQAQTAEELAEMKCGSCHLMGKITKEKLKRMSAPPYWAIAKKIKIAYKEREEGMQFLMDYTLHPSEEKMLFPQATRERFGVMPSQEGIVTQEELKVISTYILGDK